MFDIVDRREQYKDRSSSSRKRFLKRYNRYIKDAVDRTVRDSKGFTDIAGGKNSGRKVKIGKKSVDEPEFKHGEGGQWGRVLPGNRKFAKGDTIPKPQGGGSGRGSEASEDGEGEDEFAFILSRDEFLDAVLDDLELPDLVKQNLLSTVVRELVHDGFSQYGVPGQMDIVRTFRNSLGRRIGVNRKAVKKEIAELEARLEALRLRVGENLRIEPANFSSDSDTYQADLEIAEIQARLDVLRGKLRAVPFLDPQDARFRVKNWENKPTTSAVMFCIMDVSGSMTEQHKTFAKLFYFLLHCFLTRQYTDVRVVFIRHTHIAEEVTEEVFFYDRTTGGTSVLSGLELCQKIINERFDPRVWNIYIAQASDGDSFGDAEACRELLETTLLNIAQYMVYVQIEPENGNGYWRSNDLWQAYSKIKDAKPNFAMRTVTTRKEIFPVFRGLFEKKGVK